MDNLHKVTNKLNLLSNVTLDALANPAIQLL